MAQVYVGTYGKYNSGSVAGAWIDLSDCASYSDFLAKCKDTHKDERDPEFMIQDTEGFPDGLSCMEWLSEAEFNDVKAAMKEEAQEEAPAPSFEVVDYSEKAIAVTGDTRSISDSLKALGGRFNPRLSCGPGWIYSKRQEEAVRALLGGAKTATAKKEEAEAPYLVARREYLDTCTRRREYEERTTAACVKLPEGFYLIGKPSIENKFCFEDEGPDYDLYKSLRADEEKLRAYFLNANLSDFDVKLKFLEEGDDPVLVTADKYGSNTAWIRTKQYSVDYWDAVREGWRQLTDEERKAVAAALRFVRDGFEKRLQAYLKRYGVSKIQTWTYWANA